MTPLPHSLEAEEHVLACCLFPDDRGHCFARARTAGVTVDSFFDPRCRTIFSTLEKMESSGVALAYETLVPELNGTLEAVGGFAYLNQLTDVAKYPTTTHAGYFITRLRELENKRGAIRNASAIIERLAGGAELEDVRQLADGLLPLARTQGQLTGRPLTDFNLPSATDPSVLIGNRWLSRGDIAILASTSGMGKSSLSIQAAVTWALGLPLFNGFKPHRPLKSLIFQAEDGDGDIAEVRLSLEHAMGLTPEQRAAVKANVIVVTDRVHRGASFRTELARQLAIHQPDLVWINPLLAFLGGDVNDSTDVGAFLREQLNSLNEPATFAYIIVHHTAKPPKEKAQRQWNEVMYEMAGSADLTNAARAVIALQATQTPGEFNLILAKRGLRAGLTRPVAQGAGFRQEPVITISLRHSKDRMEVDGVNLPVIHWERGEDIVEETPEQKGGRKASTTIAKFSDKIPTTAENAEPIPMIHRNIKDRTDLTYNGFKKVVIRAADCGILKMVEKPGLGTCFYQPKVD